MSMSRLALLLRTGSGTAQIKPPVTEALPIRIDPEGAREAVLLLHGFSGYPGELGPLAQALVSAGYAVYAPRFPGHGTCRKDFLLTTAEDWARCAYDAYLDLRAKYTVVHVAGHSMGALLASAVAVSFDAPKLILMAPAFELSIKYIGATRLLAPFLKVITTNRVPTPFDQEDPARKALQPEYWADVMVSPASELERLRKLCRKNIERLRSQTLVIVGEADRTVPVRVAEYLRKAAPHAASFEKRLIPGASHVFPFNEHSKAMITIVLDWMSTH